MKKVIIPIHGMSMELAGYSKKWGEILNPPTEYEWKEFYWDNVNDNMNVDTNNLRGILAGPRWLFYRLFDQFMDVPKYSIGNNKDDAIKQLKAFIEAQKADEIVIVAHSLGTVLVYEMLQNITIGLSSKIKVVTFGSPLTSGFERWFLEVKQSKVFPKKWINLYGNKDFVGGRPLDIKGFNKANNFAVKTTHDEFEYLTAGREIIFREMFND